MKIRSQPTATTIKKPLLSPLRRIDVMPIYPYLLNSVQDSRAGEFRPIIRGMIGVRLSGHPIASKNHCLRIV